MFKAYRVEQLVSDLCDDEKRDKAIDILVSLGVHVVPDLLRIMEYEDIKTKNAIAAVVYKIGSPAVDGLLVALEESKDIIVQRGLIGILGDLGDERVRKSLLKILERDDRELNGDVMDSLSNIDHRFFSAMIPVDVSLSVCV